MGFTDNLTRHPRSSAPRVSKDDELFVVSRIKDFTFFLEDTFRRNKLSSNQTTAQFKTIHSDDVINQTQNERVKQGAFCPNQTQNQKRNSHSISNQISNSKHYSNYSNSNSLTTLANKIHVVTRQNPNRKTYDTEIKRRFRAPNKGKSMNNATRSNQQPIETQTDNGAEPSNVGRGRFPKDDNRHGPLFQFTDEPTPQYRHSLQQAFVEAFLA